MEFLGNVIKPGDDLTLERGSNRITVTFARTVIAPFGGGSIGVQTDLGDTFYTDDRQSAWTVVGLTQKVEPVALPTAEGFYFLTGDDQEEYFEGHMVYLTAAGAWIDGGRLSYSEVYSEEYIRANGPVVQVAYPDEHFTAISSTLDKIYNLFYVDGVLSCDCLGFVNHGHCYHSRDLKVVLDSIE